MFHAYKILAAKIVTFWFASSENALTLLFNLPEWLLAILG